MNSGLQRIYQRRFEGAERARNKVWSVLVSQYFQKWIDAGDTVLDLGAGYCEFINHVIASKKYALDGNVASAAKATAGTEVISQDVSCPWALPSSRIDVIFSSNFLEHLSSKADLQFCLEECHRVLRPGGKLLLLGPNIRFCPDLYWDFFDHQLPLSDRSLVEVLELCHFRVEKTVPRFLPFTMKGKAPSGFLVRIYLWMPVLWHIFGKQFFIVAVSA